jgi:hypothetical protein
MARWELDSEGRLEGEGEGDVGIGELVGSSSSMGVLVGTWFDLGEGAEVGKLDGIRLAMAVGTAWWSVRRLVLWWVMVNRHWSFCHLALSGWYRVAYDF